MVKRNLAGGSRQEVEVIIIVLFVWRRRLGSWVRIQVVPSSIVYLYFVLSSGCRFALVLNYRGTVTWYCPPTPRLLITLRENRVINPPFPTHILCPFTRNGSPDSPSNVRSFIFPHTLRPPIRSYTYKLRPPVRSNTYPQPQSYTFTECHSCQIWNP